MPVVMQIEDRLNSADVYLALGLIGSIVALLYGYAGNYPKMLFVAYLTVWLLAGLRIVLELRYYQRYDAIPASSQFVLLPFLVILIGQFTVHGIFTPELLNLELTTSFSGSFSFRINIATALSTPFLIFVIQIFSHLHSRQWLGFAIGRRIFRSRKVPFLVHLCLGIGMALLQFQMRAAEVASLLFIVYWLYSFYRFYLRTPSHRVSGRRTRASGYFSNPVMNSMLGSSSTRRRRPYASGSHRVRDAGPPSSRSNGRAMSLPQRNVVEVDKGITLSPQSSRKTKRKPLKNGDVSSFVPSASVKKEDLACSICYTEFKSTDGTIFVCPHCKFPSHENELDAWMKESNLCPRCSKPISPSMARSSRNRIAASSYVSKVLNRL